MSASSLPLLVFRASGSSCRVINTPRSTATDSNVVCGSSSESSCSRCSAVAQLTWPFARAARPTTPASMACGVTSIRFANAPPTPALTTQWLRVRRPIPETGSRLTCVPCSFSSFAGIKWRSVRSCPRPAVIIQAAPHMRSKRSRSTARCAAVGSRRAVSRAVIRSARVDTTRYPSGSSRMTVYSTIPSVHGGTPTVGAKRRREEQSGSVHGGTPTVGAKRRREEQ